MSRLSVRILAGVAFFFTLSVSGQIQTTVRELRENAFKKFAMGEFEAAIPDLQQLIETMKDVKTSQGMAEMEVLYYNLGMSGPVQN